MIKKKYIYYYQDRDNLYYYGIRQIEKLFGKVDKEDYYKPIWVKSAFESNYKIRESRKEKDKTLSVKEYLYMIIPYLRDMIKDHKITQSGEWKIQLNMYVNFISSKDTEW